ncbi:MAG: acetylxylan esterase, partial [Chloroflexi bacterium]|nr:acetylxylan esterase [Chloroflexota bacterium]
MSSPTPFADWDAVQYDPARHDPRTGVILKSYEARDGSTQEYSVYIPAGYAADRPWPLLLAMHGLGQHHLDIINNPQVQFAAERRGFLVVSAQGRGRRNFYRGLGEEDALRVVEEMRIAYNVDPDRVFMSGVSMGGSSSMHLGLHYP